MSYGPSGTSDHRHLSGNRALDRLRAIRAASTPLTPDEIPTCYLCGVVLFLDSDLLCPTCYQARRAPGRVLPFDPDRRRRTLARLDGRPCPDCQTVAWHVNVAGDATCQTCARRRAGGAR